MSTSVAEEPVHSVFRVQEETVYAVLTGFCSWPWQLLALVKANRPVFVTSSRCIPLKNTLG
jgi:hypothetical protein